MIEQHKILSQKLTGHYAYYGLTGNLRRLASFARCVRHSWRKWLDRRSQRARMSWDRFAVILAGHPLPRPKIVHSVYRSTASA
jgi:hypothetical protein